MLDGDGPELGAGLGAALPSLSASSWEGVFLAAQAPVAARGFSCRCARAWINTTNGKTSTRVAAGTGPASEPHSAQFWTTGAKRSRCDCGEWVWNHPRSVISTRFPQTPPRQKGPSLTAPVFPSL